MVKTTVKSQGVRRGRPALKPGSPKRSSFNTRLRDETKHRLESLAQIAGRSLSEEIEFRLEQSLRDDDALVERLGGKETYALLTVMGSVASLIQARTAKKTADWKIAHAIGRAWRRLIADSLPKVPDEWLSEFESITDQLPEAPAPPESPKMPSRGGLIPSRARKDEWNAYSENLLDFEKDMENYYKKAAEWQEAAFQQIQAVVQQKRGEFTELTKIGDDALGLLSDRDK
jgi:hypothetical protein